MTEVNGNVSDDEVEDEFEEDLDVEDDEDNARESDESKTGTRLLIDKLELSKSYPL